MSPDKLVDENDPSMWVAKRNLALVKFMKWFFFFLQGSYSQNHIKGRLWQEVLVIHWISLGPCPEVFKKSLWDWQPLPLLLVLHHNSHWCLHTASKFQCQSQKHLLKSSLCNVFLNMSIWNLQYLKMEMGKRKLQGLLWQQTSGRHWNSWGMVKIFNPN